MTAGDERPGSQPNAQPDTPVDVPGAADDAASRGATPPEVSRRGVLRTALLSGVGGVVLGGVGGGAAGWAIGSAQAGNSPDYQLSYPFYGQVHQGGIATPPQLYSMYTTFSFTSTATTRDLQVLLARWSAAIAVMQAGRPIGEVQPSGEFQRPRDTGEAYGLGPAGLTLTVGLGASVFGERFGLGRYKPAAFSELPTLNGDVLDPRLTGGDLSVHACADDPQVTYHAVRNLARMVRDVVSPHWTVQGFGRASAGPGQETPRNLLGFKDGTRNVATDEQYSQWVWISGGDQPWLEGGTYQVARKIRMLIETWDADWIGDQQTIFGRDKAEGAPLTGAKEFDTPDFAARDEAGDPVISPISHIALAAPENNDGVMIRRRAYNYTDGLNSDGQLDAGLMFISYQNNPQNFVHLQTRLGASDLLNEYIRHIGSGLFLVPPAPEEGHYIGEAIFA